MKVLGLETATPSGGVALIDGDRLVGARILWGGRAHSRHIMAGVEDLLRAQELALENLDGVAVSIGPGSFTGVRVGLAAAKAIAWATGVPVVGVGTLEGLALRALGIDDQGRALSDKTVICAILDARRGEAYWAAFRAAGESDRLNNSDRSKPCDSSESISAACGALRRLAADGVAPSREIARVVASAADGADAGGPILFCGEGAARHRADIVAALGERARFAPPHRMVAGPEEIAWLGARRLAGGERDDPMALMPIYLREPDSQFPAARRSADAQRGGC